MRLTFVTTIVSLALFAATTATADQPTPSKSSPVVKAAFNGVTPGASRERVTFGKRAPRVGDELEQSLSLEMRMATTLRQGKQIAEKSRTTARNRQHRLVTTMHVEADRAVAVRVRYIEATKQLSAADDARPPQKASGDAMEIAQPVAGKTYLCQRQPGTIAGKLEITDEAGHIPPTDEFEIVAKHMEMVGRPSPLAELLAGQSIVVGQTVAFPPKLAARLFNLGEQFGDVTRFTLTLEKLETQGGATHATFLAHVEATSNNTSQMRLELDGQLVVEADTCRTVKVDLAGPIAMSETRRNYSTSYQAIGTGQLKMNVASNYRDATR
jgi:hypothetical protein